MIASRMRGVREAIAAAVICGALGSAPAVAQTAFGASKVIVFPLVASTTSFTTSVTLYNPDASDLTVSVDYFDANNTLTPGAKPCSDVTVPANTSVAFTLASQCTLGAGSHFGLLIATDIAATHEFFGYSRTENTS
ncbi:MAG: hypothetical protein ABI533_09040, partial [Betaproteobacteria bacterium]